MGFFTAICLQFIAQANPYDDTGNAAAAGPVAWDESLRELCDGMHVNVLSSDRRLTSVTTTQVCT